MRNWCENMFRRMQLMPTSQNIDLLLYLMSGLIINCYSSWIFKNFFSFCFATLLMLSYTTSTCLTAHEKRAENFKLYLLVVGNSLFIFLLFSFAKAFHIFKVFAIWSFHELDFQLLRYNDINIFIWLCLL